VGEEDDAEPETHHQVGPRRVAAEHEIHEVHAPLPESVYSSARMSFVRVVNGGDVPVGHGVLVEHNGVSLAVFNRGGGRFAACGAVCPHEDGPLADGWIEGDAVVCPWHGFDFDLATGQCRVDEDLAIAVYPVRVVDDAVEVDLP
jgi:nitrite reductase (NADH) small subunit